MRSVEFCNWVGLVCFWGEALEARCFTSVLHSSTERPERGGGGGGFSNSAVGRVPGKERPVPSC